ncbi:MAG: hypothetical protein JOZ18_14735 [Chloroflexi bacterium]|nr:hypothetical protein [Chloroflexota bacterium]
MSQDPEKYLYFTVGFLKHSFALDALWQDALQHHMVDHPAQLIALRLTEYYELRARGMVNAATSMPPAATMPVATDEGSYSGEEAMTQAAGSNGTHSLMSQGSDDYLHDHNTTEAFSEAEQNAEEAANYWTLL